jgi:hypothetical protein
MSVVRLGTNSKAEETKDLEQRIARVSKLTVRQRIAWDRKLDCRAYRRISALPASFYRIKGLHTLLIPRNELTVIPPAIRHLSTLAYLDVSNNSLTELPHELGELPLQFLNISYNKLTWLPASIMERHPNLSLEAMCNPWQRDGDPVVRVKRPRMSTLFELCCNALAANEPLFHSVTTAPDYGALVPLHIRDYLVGASPSTGNPPHDDGDDGGDGDAEVGADDERTGGRGRKACSHCGKVFYGKAPIVRAYPRTLRTARYGENVRLVGMYCSLTCGRVRNVNGAIIPFA